MKQVRCKLDDLQPQASPEELRELEAAERLKPVFDEDSPEMTAEQLRQFRRMGPHCRAECETSDRVSQSEE